MDMKSPRMNRVAAWVTAVVLAISSFFLVLMTSDMGYSRDESFYFRFAEVYQDWFVDVSDAEGAPPSGESLDPLSREGILKTWRQNHEHPPLVKVAMGALWRGFGRKERPAQYSKGSKSKTEGEVRSAAFLRVRDLRPSHGFKKGESVMLVRPQKVGQAEEDPGRILGWAEISRRDSREARVIVPRAMSAEVSRACGAYIKGPRFVRGCGVVSPGLVSEGTAMRLVGPISTALMVFGMVLWGWFGLHPIVGLLAPLLFLSTPRWFYHAHLAAFDMPVTAMVFLVTLSFWYSLSSFRWAWATAVIWGFAILTKHNALFLPVPLLAYWLIEGRRDIAVNRLTRSPRQWLGISLALLAVLCAPVGLLAWRATLVGVFLLGFLGLRVRLPRIPTAFLLMLPIGLTMLFSLWPKLWVDPYRALESYFSFHLRHEHYLQYYLGSVLEVPPFPMAFPFVMTLFTVPALTLLVALVGGVDLAGPVLRGFRNGYVLPRKRTLALGLNHRSRLGLYLFISTLFPVALIALPTTPIFGGVKHWMTGMPFLCMIAAWGIWRLAVYVRESLGGERAWPAYFAAALLGIAVLLPGAYATQRSALVGNTHYNSLVGGISGAADAKLTRIYWGYSSVLAFDYINRRLPTGARVFFHDTTYDAFRMYRREGKIRHDIRFANTIDRADAALFEEQKFFAQLQLDIQRHFDVPGPEWSWRIEGVPIVSLYLRSGFEMATSTSEQEPGQATP